MAEKNFTATIELTKSTQDVFKAITVDVAKWWGGKDLEGSCTKLNDEFIIHHHGAHYSKQKLVEVIQNKRIVWVVMESYLNWLKKDPQEWSGTRMVFEITAKSDITVLHFTHEGLFAEKESYLRCSAGWDMVIKDWLFNYIMHDTAHF
ncbi:MAG TPA: SRPBCC domain-containing protein [Puia sp.]|nr:SRPBCC domain-containing protein [Puia sp.]